MGHQCVAGRCACDCACPRPAMAGISTDATPAIAVSADSAAVGAWIDVTLENGPAGHKGYFTADAPLFYAAPDGTSKAYPYQIVIGADGRARRAYRLPVPATGC